jgi:glycosyltransferase 2 family protein
MRLNGEWNSLPDLALGPIQWVALGGIAVASATVILLQSVAWWRLLSSCGIAVPASWATKTFGVTQLAKYVPGNIMHLAGRQTVGLSAGLPGLPLAKSIGLEIAIQVVAGTIVALLYLPVVLGYPAEYGIVATVLLGGAALLAGRAWLGRDIAIAGAFHALYLFLSGTLFVQTAIVIGVFDNLAGAAMPIIGGFVIAWLAGFVTPGAPAGLGIREAGLLLLLTPYASEERLLTVIILHRVASIIGDLLHFACAWAIRAHLTEKVV